MKKYIVRLASLDRVYSYVTIEAENLKEFSIKVKALFKLYPDKVLVDFEVESL